MNNDIFARVKAIAAGEMAQPANWVHEIDKPLIGRIKGFSSFHHDRYGMQETVIVETESGELVSAILNDYLIEGMRRQRAEVNDLVFIEKLGQDNSKNGNCFNKYVLVIDKV
jgi:hypothetical protein